MLITHVLPRLLAHVLAMTKKKGGGILFSTINKKKKVL